jgi:hypothetical protein
MWKNSKAKVALKLVLKGKYFIKKREKEGKRIQGKKMSK